MDHKQIEAICEYIATEHSFNHNDLNSYVYNGVIQIAMMIPIEDGKYRTFHFYGENGDKPDFKFYKKGNLYHIFYDYHINVYEQKDIKFRIT